MPHTGMLGYYSTILLVVDVMGYIFQMGSRKFPFLIELVKLSCHLFINFTVITKIGLAQ